MRLANFCKSTLLILLFIVFEKPKPYEMEFSGLAIEAKVVPSTNSTKE